MDPLRPRNCAFQFQFNTADLNQQPEIALHRQEDKSIVPIVWDDSECSEAVTRDLTDEEVKNLTKQQKIERCMNCKDFQIDPKFYNSNLMMLQSELL